MRLGKCEFCKRKLKKIETFQGHGNQAFSNILVKEMQ